MNTQPIATFNELAPAQRLQEQFIQAGVTAVINDESKLERFWFMAEPLAAVHVEVPPADYVKARQLVGEWEKSGDSLQAAMRCPECHSPRVEFPQNTRKFYTPAICHTLLTVLHILPREYYCLDCHHTWPKVARVAPELDILGWPLNSKLWHPERFPKRTPSAKP